MRALRALLESKFAEIAFSMHATSARDEMAELANEFQILIDRTSKATPNIDLLEGYGEMSS